jgi:hypothetical protein
MKGKLAELRGDHLDEMISDLKKHSTETRERIDEIYRATLDGEERWLRREQDERG